MITDAESIRAAWLGKGQFNHCARSVVAFGPAWGSKWTRSSGRTIPGSPELSGVARKHPHASNVNNGVIRLEFPSDRIKCEVISRSRALLTAGECVDAWTT